MTSKDYKAALNANIDAILNTPEVTLEQKRAVVDQMIRNLNTDTVNPDHVAHPVIKG